MEIANRNCTCLITQPIVHTYFTSKEKHTKCIFIRSNCVDCTNSVHVTVLLIITVSKSKTVLADTRVHSHLFYREAQ